MRYLLYSLGDESIPEPPPSPELFQKMGEFVEDANRAGVLIATGGIGPTESGMILTRKDGEYTVTDGPFTEAKELIGGWAICDFRDRDEAIEWAKRFREIVGDGESRIRPVFMPE